MGRRFTATLPHHPLIHPYAEGYCIDLRWNVLFRTRMTWQISFGSSNYMVRTHGLALFPLHQAVVRTLTVTFPIDDASQKLAFSYPRLTTGTLRRSY